MKIIYKDIYTDYMPVSIQLNKTSGAVTDPTVDNLSVYKVGDSASFSLTQVTGSPFDPAKINDKTGLWGIMIAKSVFAINTNYLFYWEVTVDGIETAKREDVFVCDSEAFKVKKTKVYTVSVGEVALEGVKVKCSTDVNGNNVICFGTTNADGQVTFLLNAGTYYMWLFKSGYTFGDQPDIEVVP